MTSVRNYLIIMTTNCKLTLIIVSRVSIQLLNPAVHALTTLSLSERDEVDRGYFLPLVPQTGDSVWNLGPH